MKTCEALRLSLLATILGPGLALSADDFETVHTSNAAVLNRLGLVPLEATGGQQRKRLAGPPAFAAGKLLQRQEPSGRRHGAAPAARDSHVYVVKLPASPTYYSFARPHKLPGLAANVTLADPHFRSNGRPAKIYQWNLPLVKRINQKKKHLALAKAEQARKSLEADRERQRLADKVSYLKRLAQEQLVSEGHRKPSRNNDKWLGHPERPEPRAKVTENATQLKILPSGEKSYRLEEAAPASRHRVAAWPPGELPARNALDHATKKHRKKAAVSYYYAPSLAGKAASTSISKHFPGNGKPKAFYVMEKSRKPAYYHPLLP